MERLTSNKEVSEMSMYKLAHNSCYAKDGKARVRDYENDFDARELIIKLLEKYADIPNEFTCDEDFDDFMLDSLQYGTDSILGLISVFYQNLWAMADLRETLKHYEDLEEQGKLWKLPCAPGQPVWKIKNGKIQKWVVGTIKIEESGVSFYNVVYICDISDFGKTVFFTREEAEAALKALEEQNNAI